MLYRNRYSEGILGVCIFVVELFSDGRITEIGPIYIPSSFESGIRSLKEERLRERDIKKMDVASAHVLHHGKGRTRMTA